jgi:hypothetical protein
MESLQCAPRHGSPLSLAQSNAHSMNDELLKVMSTAGMTQLALESLRAGDTSRALEVLELELDASVVALGRLAKVAEHGDRDRATAILKMIRQYRYSHPRRLEADFSATANGVLVRAAREAGARANQILEEVN